MSSRIAIVAVTSLLAACSDITFVTRMRDTSPRPKPVLVWGRMSAGPVSQESVPEELSTFFGNVPIDSAWSVDRVTLTGVDPRLRDAAVYSLVGWLELDGRTNTGCAPLALEDCFPTEGDVQFAVEVPRGYPIVFEIEFRE